jgi:hypothetical protein
MVRMTYSQKLKKHAKSLKTWLTVLDDAMTPALFQLTPKSTQLALSFGTPVHYFNLKKRGK